MLSRKQVVVYLGVHTIITIIILPKIGYSKKKKVRFQKRRRNKKLLFNNKRQSFICVVIFVI